MTETTWTVNTIQAAMVARGSHWWDADTMQSFGTVPASPVFHGKGGVYFVTEDRDFYGKQAYTIRRFHPESCEIDTFGELASRGRKAAITQAKRLAAEDGPIADITQAAERFKPLARLDCFLRDCQTHGSKDTARDTCHKLMVKAKAHHKYMEAQCNGEWPYDKRGGDDHPPLVQKARREIRTLAERVGATGVVFRGDPRGCTVKLTFADGYTNDFGNTGYCVPTEE